MIIIYNNHFMANLAPIRNPFSATQHHITTVSVPVVRIFAKPL